MLHDSTTDPRYPTIRIRLRLHVASRVAHHARSARRQRHARRSTGVSAPPTTVSAERRRQTDLPEKSVPARHTAHARASLASVQRACQLQISRLRLPVSSWSGAALPIR